MNKKPNFAEKVNRIIDNNATVLYLKNGLERVQTDVAGLKTDVSDLKSDVAVLKTDVAGLKTDVSDLKSDVAVLKTDVAVLKTDVATLKTSVEKLIFSNEDLVGKVDVIFEGMQVLLQDRKFHLQRANALEAVEQKCDVTFHAVKDHITNKKIHVSAKQAPR